MSWGFTDCYISDFCGISTLVRGSLTSSTENEIQVCDDENDELEYFSKSMIAVNKSVDEQSPAESERYTLDQFIDDHIRENFKILSKNYPSKKKRSMHFKRMF